MPATLDGRSGSSPSPPPRAPTTANVREEIAGDAVLARIAPACGQGVDRGASGNGAGVAVRCQQLWMVAPARERTPDRSRPRRPNLESIRTPGPRAYASARRRSRPGARPERCARRGPMPWSRRGPLRTARARRHLQSRQRPRFAANADLRARSPAAAPRMPTRDAREILDRPADVDDTVRCTRGA